MILQSYDTIWKYNLDVTDWQEIEMPVACQILDCQMQDDKLCLWAVVDSGSPKAKYRFCIIGTGNPIPQDVELEYISTVQERQFVWHVFLVLNSNRGEQ